jgi:hypothetical protein
LENGNWKQLKVLTASLDEEDMRTFGNMTFKWVHISAVGGIGTMTGKWNFIHDDQRRENKTKLLLQPESISGEWPTGVIIQFPLRQQSPIFNVVELRHKKIVLSRSYEVENIGSSTGFPITGSETFRFVPR